MYEQIKKMWNMLSVKYKRYILFIAVGTCVLSLAQYINNKMNNQINDKPIVIGILGISAIAVIFFGSNKKRQEQEQKRKEQLIYDYSEMITKITLLISAGMTVRRAWERIVKDYQVSKATNLKSKRYVYEEMEESYNQFMAGMSEVYIYENFGRRCNTKEYLKFSSMLVTNLRKGNSDLLRLLELESIDAYENRKNQAVRFGEEAGTKLLFPMIIMLAIVMAVIMVPAMMSFSM